jgi:hypothetical protein
MLGMSFFSHSLNAHCHASLEVAGRDAGRDFKEAEHIKLVDFLSYLFSQFVVKSRGKFSTTIDFPGPVSTAVATCLFSKEETEHLLAAVFKIAVKLEHKGNEVPFPLRMLFGSFNDYSSFMRKVG